MRLLVILPSFNEAENVVALTEEILAVSPNYHVCIVDDSSPDGTSGMVQRAMNERAHWRPRVHLITRSKKDGRGGAVRDGFVWGLEHKEAFEGFVEMDCDFSHDPKSLPQGVSQLTGGQEVVIGSRYPNGKILGWPWQRRLFSICANALTRTLISRQVTDYTTGYRLYNRRAVEFLVKQPQQHKGYIYLSESLALLLKAGFRVGAFPIVFKNRERGVSNTSFSEISSALSGIFKIAWEYRIKS